MARQTHEINGEIFTTQKALVKRIQEILNRYDEGQFLDMFDYPFILDLLRHHAHADQKIGVGVAGIYVASNEIYPGKRSRCFHVMRVDDTYTDFSYRKCIKTPSHEKKAKNALRVAVELDTIAYKQAQFDKGEEICCPETGEILTFTTAHVDHISPRTFDVLVTDFMACEGLSFEDISVVPLEDNQYQDRLADLELERRWIEYHRENADLELVSHAANLSIRRRRLDSRAIR